MKEPIEWPFAGPGADAIQGAVVLRVMKDSPASTAGLQEREVITAVDGEQVDGPQAVADAIAEHRPGDSIVLTVYRLKTGEESDIEVELGENPDKPGRAYLGVWLGPFLWLKEFELDQVLPGFEPKRDDWYFEWPPGKLPFEEFRHHFELPWPPGDEGCDGEDCLDNGV
jgi:hypothetical protein